MIDAGKRAASWDWIVWDRAEISFRSELLSQTDADCVLTAAASVRGWPERWSAIMEVPWHTRK